MVFAVSFLALGYLGMQPPTGTVYLFCQIFTVSVLRVLRADAVLLAHRKDQAGSDEGHAVRIAVIALRSGPESDRRTRSRRRGAKLEPANNNIANVASLQRGAKYFVNYCLGCHSAKYVRYNRVAQDLADHREAAGRQSDVHGRTAVRHDGERDAAGGRRAVVRPLAARSVADGARARHRLYLHVPARLLRRAEPAHRRRQHRAAGHGHAARAVEAAGRAAREVHDRRRARRRAGVRGVRVDPAGRAALPRNTTTSCATS